MPNPVLKPIPGAIIHYDLPLLDEEFDAFDDVKSCWSSPHTMIF